MRLQCSRLVMRVIIINMTANEPAKPIILVVDDEAPIRLGVAATVKKSGYQVIVAENGEDALEKARNNSPDLIISDVNMPNMDGFEMRRRLSRDEKLAAIPFIFLTARSATEDRITGLKNADDYITKPFASEELIARIEAVLRRVRTQRELGREEARQRLSGELDTLKREILQNFHHELRTPLGNVMMALEMAVNQRYENPQDQSDFLNIALSSADRMESLVENIVMLADIDQKQLNTIRMEIDPQNHILMPIEKIIKRYESKEIIFTHHFEITETIKAPRREFSRAVSNIVDNAFKFGPRDGKVHLSIKSRPGGSIVITVTDEGPGIAKDLREKVFERFFQASRGDTREHQGLGIGLSITRALFEALGGYAQIVDSEKGCVVEAMLPPPSAGEAF